LRERESWTGRPERERVRWRVEEVMMTRTSEASKFAASEGLSNTVEDIHGRVY
jgi:hypothetical protein